MDSIQGVRISGSCSHKWIAAKSDLWGKLGLELMQNDSFWNEYKVNVWICRKSKLPCFSPFLPRGYIPLPNNTTPCNSVYIIVYILGIHCTLSYKSCPTEYIPDVFRKWQLCSLNYDRAIDHQPPCKPDSFLFSCCSWSRRRRILLLLLKCCNLKIWKVGAKGEASSLFNPKTKSNWVKKCVMPFPKI